MTDLFSNSNESVFKPQFSAYNDNYFTELVRNHLENANNTDEFYAKLVELKNEQKKQLLFMQELYEQKQTLKDEIEKSAQTLIDLKTNPYPAVKTEDYNYRLNTISAYENNLGHESLNRNDEIPVHSSFDAKPPPAPTRSSTVTFHNNLDIIENSTKSSAKLIESLDDDIIKIERMWDDFKLNSSDINLKSIEFNEKFVKKIKKNSDKSVKSKSKTPQVEWMPRVTVPEPFSMTIREKIKTDKKQEKILKEMQLEREKRIEAELIETKRKFKANPVPAHVVLPLYEKKLIDEELRKHKIKRLSKEYLEKVSKPFNLTDTATLKNKTKERPHSVCGNNTVEMNKKSEFNANPLPEFYLNEEYINEKMKENELYKQINKQMRSLELLKQSKLPHNMEMQEAKKLLEMEQNQMFIDEINRLQKEIDIKEAKINQRKTHEIPDYDEQYRKFTVELENKKNKNRKHIKTEPFVLRAVNRTRKSFNQSNQSNIKLNRSNSSMSRLNKSLSQSMDSLPIKYTESHRLRHSVNKSKIEDDIKKELQQEHIEKIKKLRMKKLHGQIQETAHYDPSEVNKNIERQTRKLKLEDKRKEEEYEQKIAEMGKKIETRKLQINQVDEENIRRTLEKKYNETLKRAGIVEHELRKTNSYMGQVAKSVNHAADDNWINE